MGKEMKNETSAVKQAVSKHTRQDIDGFQLIDFGESTGFACDVQTGICGPIDQNKEDEK
ncbi:hypothetical protein QL992_14395 [Microbacterium sp. APC 3898]|uniref:Uncharacterized protein n=1 Tax=Planococcus notacanthi TaxID=3035188 RepID=A0ABT7ZHJ1_9BACL|nr:MULTISPECIES: hypothetical protein [Terrabacteria group]MBF6633192.1 hypothetical protein [Planococcus sp. (in: firmicutes)]MDN3426630.1 hypothetical protein [Planococcus sp. APC 4016]MDN3437890.1 hypothetical protein [Planococcus sp. APC 3900]MDN3500406.1 hypothetical protein [Microbacterium sp. APC 3898]